MSCSAIDLKGYSLGELEEAERKLVEEHVSACQSCGEEFEHLHLTRTALESLRDEELPRRIAFVSDKIFEPRWWQSLWSSGARWVFASASVLAAAIVMHAFVVRPVTVPPAQPDMAAVHAFVEKEVSRRVGDAVAIAVAQAQAREEKKTAKLLAAAEGRFELKRQEDRLIAEQSFEELKKRMNVMYLASAWRGEGR